MRWRVLTTAPLSGAENMALDEALLARAHDTGEAVLRIYGWRRATLSFGRNQVAAGRYDARRAADMGIEFVRRPTGGRAVLHHREVTYSVTAPVAALGGLRESYGRINRLLIVGLGTLGADVAEVAPAGRAAPRPVAAPCFETPVSGELVAGGRKLVGSAQWRDRGALLQHGSILIDDDQALASALLVSPRPATPAPATLRALLGRAPEPAEVAAALAAAIRSVECAEAVPLSTDDALRAATRAAVTRYQADAWTWRR